MNSTHFARAGLVTLLLGAAAPAWAGSYIYTTLPFSGLASIGSIAINDTDEVVGTFVPTSTERYHGFVWSGGTLTQVDYPNSVGTGLNSINSSGLAVGFYDDTSGVRHPISYNTTTKTFTVLQLKSAPPNVNDAATSINAGGQIVGISGQKGDIFLTTVNGKTSYIGPKNKKAVYSPFISDTGTIIARHYTGNRTRCYVYSDGQVSSIELPGSKGLCNISPTGLIFGTITSKTIYSGFRYIDGAINTFQYPGSTDTEPTGMNSGGDIAGFYYVNGGQGHEGFVQLNGAYYTLDVPNAVSTLPYAINASASLAGVYYDQNNALQAYIAQCPQDQQPCTQ